MSCVRYCHTKSHFPEQEGKDNNILPDFWKKSTKHLEVKLLVLEKFAIWPYPHCVVSPVQELRAKVDLPQNVVATPLRLSLLACKNAYTGFCGLYTQLPLRTISHKSTFSIGLYIVLSEMLAI